MVEEAVLGEKEEANKCGFMDTKNEEESVTVRDNLEEYDGRNVCQLHRAIISIQKHPPKRTIKN